MFRKRKSDVVIKNLKKLWCKDFLKKHFSARIFSFSSFSFRPRGFQVNSVRLEGLTEGFREGFMVGFLGDSTAACLEGLGECWGGLTVANQVGWTSN